MYAIWPKSYIYNGVGDTIALSGIMASGSVNLYSPNASFDSSYVDKLVWIAGADIAGADLLTSVSSVLSSSGLVLNKSSKNSISGKLTYIGTDNSSQINSLIQEVSNQGGGEVYIPAGFYFLSIYSPNTVIYQHDNGSGNSIGSSSYAATAIVMKSNVSLRGAGKNTILFSPKGASPTGSNEDPWQWGNWPAVIGSYNQSKMIVSDLCVSQGVTWGTSETDSWGMYFNGCSDTIVQRCEVWGIREDGIRFDQWQWSGQSGPPSYRNSVIDCHVHNCGGQAVEFESTNQVMIKGCRLHNSLNFQDSTIGDAECMIIGGGCKDLQIIDNYISQWGACISLNGNITNVIVKGNIFYDGALFWADSAVTSGICISNNINYLASVNSDQRSQNVTTKGLIGPCVINDNILSTNYLNSIQVLPNSSGYAQIMINNNICNNEIVVSSGGGALKTTVVYNQCSGVNVNTLNPIVYGNI